jgi:hypothetical protein
MYTGRELADNRETVYSGGKMMRNIWSLMKFNVAFCFVLLAFGFATSKSLAANGNIAVKAEAVDEGICVNFENIPPETTSIFIHFSASNSVSAYSARNIVSTYSDIRGSALEQVKRKGKIVLPFVKPGWKYIISVSFEKDDEPLTDDDFFTECTPYSGIYFAEGIELRLNETYTGVTLSREPVFPVAVSYAPVKYDFRAFLDLYGIVSFSYSEKETVRGLTWDFEPFMTQYFYESGYLQRGDYPVFIIAYCNLIHDDISWTVEIAKSGEFTFSL